MITFLVDNSQISRLLDCKNVYYANQTLFIKSISELAKILNKGSYDDLVKEYELMAISIFVKIKDDEETIKELSLNEEGEEIIDIYEVLFFNYDNFMKFQKEALSLMEPSDITRFKNHYNFYTKKLEKDS